MKKIKTNKWYINKETKPLSFIGIYTSRKYFGYPLSNISNLIISMYFSCICRSVIPTTLQICFPLFSNIIVYRISAVFHCLLSFVKVPWVCWYAGHTSWVGRKVLFDPKGAQKFIYNRMKFMWNICHICSQVTYIKR